MDLYTIIFSEDCFNINEKVLEKYNILTDIDIKKKTHFFNNRYENIYLDENIIPEIKVIVDTALEHAAKILNVDIEKLSTDYWLNFMQLGDITTVHTHNDTDEILSCVYYIKVPENSGDLILEKDDKKMTITPTEGSFIYFLPNVLHEVSVNNNAQPRLSVAFNFGLS